MKYVFKFASANLLRAKRRTILTFMVLSVGVAMYIFMMGLLKGMDETSFQNLIEFETGHFKIRSMDFDEDMPYAVSNYIKNYKDIEKVIDGKDYVTGYTERIQFLAEADNGIDSLPVVVYGINTKTDSRVFTLTNFISEGELVSKGVLIGKNLAKDMGLGLSNTVFVTFRTAQGMYSSLEFLISGILESPDPQVNNTCLFIHIEEAKELLNVDSVTEITVKTKNYEKYKPFEKDLKSSLPNSRIYSWHDLSKAMLAITQTKSKTSQMFAFMIVIIALVGIINTMLMSVYEKQREIGTLKALGMTDKDVRQVFVYEGLLIGFFGGMCGLILGALMNWYFAAKGIDVTAMMGEGDMNIGYRVMGVVRAGWSGKAYINGLVLAILSSLVASYYPASKTVKMQPMECLRINQ